MGAPSPLLSLAKLSYEYNADDNVTSFAQAYLGKAVTASGAASIVGPWVNGLGNEGKTRSKSDSAISRNPFAIFFAWCAPFVLALFFLLRGSARRRLGWLAPALLGVFLGGCGGCSSNDSGAAGPKSSTTYLYDAANRLTAAQDVGPASYSYDAASNLTSIQTSAASSAGGTAPQSYSYSSTNGISGATYDANGNPTSLGGATYTWDSANRIASATVGSTSSTFTYDGMSHLVRIVDKNGGNVVADRAFTWCGDMRCAAHDNLQGGSPVVTRYFDQGVVDAGTALYQVRDLLGSVRQLVDATGKVRAQYDYDPYGNRTKVAGDVDSEIGYAGYYHHAASGLDLTVYRAYDPSHGRWLNRDPIGESGGTNVYQYVGGSPVNGTDPDGLLSITFSPAAFGLGFIEGYIISAGFNAAGQALGSSSGCVDWGEANEAGLIGGLLGGLGAGVGIGGGEGPPEDPACPDGVCDGNTCFSGETRVATESGEKPIQDVAVGERVWSKDANDGDVELLPVTQRYVTPNESLLDLEIIADDGRDELLRATPTHRFWVEGQGWTVAADLRAGDRFELRSGKQAVLARVERETKKSTVYNLEVDGDHTYFVGDEGVWVHNGCGPTNPVPKTVARVIPGDVDYPTLGKPGDSDVFVTDANAIAGLGAQEISDALTIPASPVYTVYEFPTPSDGLASPVGRGNDGFVGGGQTQGGAPEYVIPNGAIPNDAVRRLVR